jgi:serine/threonine protein kinase
LHCDIKPENILIDSEGFLKISDFIISKNQNSSTDVLVSGTPGYMGNY